MVYQDTPLSIMQYQAIGDRRLYWSSSHSRHNEVFSGGLSFDSDGNRQNFWSGKRIFHWQRSNLYMIKIHARILQFTNPSGWNWISSLSKEELDSATFLFPLGSYGDMTSETLLKQRSTIK